MNIKVIILLVSLATTGLAQQTLFPLYTDTPNQTTEDLTFDQIILLNGTKSELDAKNGGAFPMEAGELAVQTDQPLLRWRLSGTDYWTPTISGTSVSLYSSGSELSLAATGTATDISLGLLAKGAGAVSVANETGYGLALTGTDMTIAAATLVLNGVTEINDQNGGQIYSGRTFYDANNFDILSIQNQTAKDGANNIAISFSATNRRLYSAGTDNVMLDFMGDGVGYLVAPSGLRVNNATELTGGVTVTGTTVTERLSVAYNAEVDTLSAGSIAVTSGSLAVSGTTTTNTLNVTGSAVLFPRARFFQLSGTGSFAISSLSGGTFTTTGNDNISVGPNTMTGSGNGNIALGFGNTIGSTTANAYALGNSNLFGVAGTATSTSVGFNNVNNAANSHIFGAGITNATANMVAIGPSNAAKTTIDSNGDMVVARNVTMTSGTMHAGVLATQGGSSASLRLYDTNNSHYSTVYLDEDVVTNGNQLRLRLGGTRTLALGGDMVTSTGTNAFTLLSTTGNVTLGDASGDTLTVNAGTVTAPNATSTASGNNLINLATQDARFLGIAARASGTDVMIGTSTTTYVTPAALNNATLSLKALAVESLVVTGNTPQTMGMDVIASGTSLDVSTWEGNVVQLTGTGNITNLTGLSGLVGTTFTVYSTDIEGVMFVHGNNIHGHNNQNVQIARTEAATVVVTSASTAIVSKAMADPFVTSQLEYVVPFYNISSGASGTGMSVSTSYQGAIQLSYSLSGTSTGSENAYATMLRGLGNNPGTGSGTRWDHRIAVRASIIMTSAGSSGAGTKIRLLAGTTVNNAGTLAGKGIGVECEVDGAGNVVTSLLQHDGSTLTSVTASPTLNTASAVIGSTLILTSNSGTVQLWGANDLGTPTLLATGTNGPTGNGSGGNDYVVVNIASGTSGQINPAVGIRVREIKVQERP